MEYTYIIKTKADITQAMLDVCQENEVEDLRTSLDGTLAVLKWIGEDPPVFDGETKYTHTEILTEMAGANWTPPDPT